MRTAAEMAKEQGGTVKEIAIAIRNGGRKAGRDGAPVLTVEPA